MFVDDWTKEDFDKVMKWARDNFNLEDIKFKNKTKVTFNDLVSGTDHSVEETFYNKDVHKYYLEDCDGPEWKGYNDGMLLVWKLFQLGIAAGPIVMERWQKKAIKHEKELRKNKTIK